MKLRFVGLLVVMITAALAAMLVNNKWHDARALAREEFIHDSENDFRTGQSQAEKSIRSIYENLRILSSLPGVKIMDSHATNLDAEARITIQQIYNNLASNVDVSEIYFTPINFEPNQIDPLTNRHQQPSIVFDELILNAGLQMSIEQRAISPEAVRQAKNLGPPEVETFEYAQLKDHAKWLKINFPTMKDVGGLNVPFVAGPEVITCDNTHYITTLKDADRSGVIFTVPVYAEDGNIKGMVSAIMLTSALKAMVGHSNLALVNPGNNFAAISNSTSFPQSSLSHLLVAEPDPSLIYSEVTKVAIRDFKSPWYFWSGLPNSSFEQSREVELTDSVFKSILLLLGSLTAGAVSALLLSTRLIEQSRKLAATSRQSEAEALSNSERLRLLNEDVTRLNTDLADKMHLLQQSQTEMVKQEKMAQLGQLVATVAHEIRNPLGSIRTSTFLLRRKLSEKADDIIQLFDRVEKGVTRCDQIISQLLDYSKSSKPNYDLVVVDEWLESVVAEKAQSIPAEVRIVCDMGFGDHRASFDRGLMSRAITNLVTNAYQAMLDDRRNVTRFHGSLPTITVTSDRTRRGVEFKVTDNGPGIPEDVMKHIREPLFTTKSFGTGLGIPVVERAAIQHGGGLEVRSEPGHGAAFTIWFPAQPDDMVKRAA